MQGQPEFFYLDLFLKNEASGTGPRGLSPPILGAKTKARRGWGTRRVVPCDSLGNRVPDVPNKTASVKPVIHVER